ncbi:MAG: glycosyltransferase [Deltaproteobacteria bacterium]
MTTVDPPSKIAVVIATCNRRRLLADRSLPSVTSQTRRPDLLVVVDDSTPLARPANAELIESIELGDCEIVYLENQRTDGAGGTWNTALDFLASERDDPSSLFVAFLDDDDAWPPEYLERCATTAHDLGLDMVAAGLRRFESMTGPPLFTEGPPALRAEDFLTGNPGIQGSNLYVRLSVLLAAGGFDEDLPSTTDRDLCIRIAELGTVRYGPLSTVWVDHYANADRSRLSTRGSSTKLEGLTTFSRKYGGRMTAAQRREFLDRGDRLFDWRPPNDIAFALPPDEGPKRALVLGLIADNDRPEDLLEMLRVLTATQDDALVGLDVVLLEFGRRSGTHLLIDDASAQLRGSGCGCFRISLEHQNADMAGELLRQRAPCWGRPTAEANHALLRFCCARIAAERTGAEAWVVEGSARTGRSPTATNIVAVLDWLQASRADNGRHSTSSVDDLTARAFDRWIRSERVTTAEHRVRRRFALEELRLLGCGSEAVVLTDGRLVYKCIDYWKTRMPHAQLDFLRSQVDKWEDAPGLYPLRNVVEDGPWAVLIYDYESSTPYEGGRDTDLIRLLDSCCRVGVVCNNIHPKNLVVTPSGVRLIDYGSDIRPWTPLGFEHMVRRAFLACRHASHPDLKALMRRVLTDDRLAEMNGYRDFKARVERKATHSPRRVTVDSFGEPPPHPPLRLYVGVITSDPPMLEPLLSGLASLASSNGRQSLAVLVLDNGSPPGELDVTIREARSAGLRVAVIDDARQRIDAGAERFGAALGSLPLGRVGIATARTILQRYLGAVLAADAGSFGWLLDDDMRVDGRARAYLPWLPTFREQGTDVLIGAYEGASPNPPLNGLRVHLVDLIHNIHWLRNLPGQVILPDRSEENNRLRARFPDYYYDLSRKHTGHLEMPHWLEPAACGETVREAYARLMNGAIGLLNGAPLTRPLIATAPADPLAAARESVNRGGCTWILNHRALTETPNTITTIQGREARRSDMIWAIVNRHYRRLRIQAVSFPIHHIGRVNVSPTFDMFKVQAEIVGSTLYAGLTEFLRTRPRHRLDFSHSELGEVCSLVDRHLDRRWRLLEQSFHRIAGLREALRGLARPGELRGLIGYLDEWFTPQSFARLRAGVASHQGGNVSGFLGSLRSVADDYARTNVDVDFIRAQLRETRATSHEVNR